MGVPAMQSGNKTVENFTLPHAKYHGPERRGVRRRLEIMGPMIWIKLRYWLFSGIIDAVRIGLRSNVEGMHFWLSFGHCLYGFWLMMPFETFSPAVSLLSRLLPEPILGLMLLCVGRYGLHAITVSEAKDRECAICNASRWNFAMYITLLLAQVLAGWRNIGTAVFFVAVCRSLWVNDRACGDGLSKGKNRQRGIFRRRTDRTDVNADTRDNGNDRG